MIVSKTHSFKWTLQENPKYCSITLTYNLLWSFFDTSFVFVERLTAWIPFLSFGWCQLESSTRILEHFQRPENPGFTWPNHVFHRKGHFGNIITILGNICKYFTPYDSSCNIFSFTSKIVYTQTLKASKNGRSGCRRFQKLRLLRFSGFSREIRGNSG